MLIPDLRFGDGRTPGCGRCGLHRDLSLRDLPFIGLALDHLVDECKSEPRATWVDAARNCRDEDAQRPYHLDRNDLLLVAARQDPVRTELERGCSSSRQAPVATF